MPTTENGQLTIEKTPSYFVKREVPLRVHQMSKNIKLLLVVRNPLMRAISGEKKFIIIQIKAF